MDNFILQDYASWKIENHEVLSTFKTNKNPVYQRLEPVYIVLEHIYNMACNSQELDEDLETIFEIGFNYLNAQFSVIKIYYESLFKSNCEDFNKYSEMLIFLLYIYDIRTDLDNNDIDSDIDILNDVETYIENMIMERREDYDFVRNMMNEALKTVFDKNDYDYVSIIDIYVEIAENFGIFIYEEDQIILGEDV